MEISNNGIELIKSFEGFSPKACKCVPTEKYYTIGFGHYGEDVSAYDTITKEQATELLRRDLKSFNKKVDKYTSRYSFNQNEFDALVSFCYNVGNIDGLTKNGTRTKSEIADAFLLYNKSGGTVLKGLTTRRNKERELFLKSDNTKYYDRYEGNSTNIDMIFKTVGVPDKYLHNYKNRVPIANANGIKNYTGSAVDNIKLITLAKSGKLKRV